MEQLRHRWSDALIQDRVSQQSVIPGTYAILYGAAEAALFQGGFIG